jgi:hypothetical protein
MDLNITINVSEGAVSTTSNVGGKEKQQIADGFGAGAALGVGANDVGAAVNELVNRMGDDISPFPKSGIDAFMSHFLITMQFLKGPRKGEVHSFSMPSAIQTVSRSDPFEYQGPAANTSVQIPLPPGCTLSGQINEADFLERPRKFFQIGKQMVWMQILNLDSQMNTELGPIRIILGETLKREYPGIFQPSLGVAESLGKSGFPARLFYNPVAVIQTNFGEFRAIHGTLSYDRTVAFPPIGTPITIEKEIPMELVGDLGQFGAAPAAPIEPSGRIIALSHPIDMSLHVPGEEAFGMLETRINSKRPGA